MSHLPQDSGTLLYSGSQWHAPRSSRDHGVPCDRLGDIVFVSLPEVGDAVAAGDACGELESTKSLSGHLSPVPGVITALNASLDHTGNRQRRRSGMAGSSSRACRECRRRRPDGCRFLCGASGRVSSRSAACRLAVGPQLSITSPAFEAVNESRGCRSVPTGHENPEGSNFCGQLARRSCRRGPSCDSRKRADRRHDQGDASDGRGA